MAINQIVGGEGLTSNPMWVQKQYNDAERERSLQRALQEQEFRARQQNEQRQMAIQQAMAQQQAQQQERQFLEAQRQFALDLALRQEAQKQAARQFDASLGLEREQQSLVNMLKQQEMEQRIIKANAPKEITPYQREYLNLQANRMATEEPRRERQLKQQELRDVSNMRKEFISRPEVEDFIKSKTNVDAMESMYRSATTGDKNERVKNLIALDQSLITIFNKLTDPASVVRESEYARTPGNAPMVNKIIGAWEQMKSGSAGLTMDDRQALIQGAKILMDERGKTFNKTLGEYASLAEKYGYNPEMVTRGIGEYKPYYSQLVETANQSADNYGFRLNEIRNANGKAYKYLGNNQWSEI